MNKDNILFAVIGLLFGLIVGFVGANYINRNAAPVGGIDPNNQLAGLPPDHPAVQQGQLSQQAMLEIQAAQEKADAEPQNFEAQQKAGELLYQVQRFDDAIKYLSKANELQPDNYAVIVVLGNATFDAMKFEEAEKWYAKALEQKSDDINVRTDMGLTFIFREPPDYDRAVAEFLKSLEVNPNHPQTLQNLVVAYAKKNDAAKANETLAKLEAADPGNQSISKLKEEIEKISAPGSGS